MNSTQKSNKALRLAIKDLLQMSDTREESIKEIHRYKREFPNEIDYNLAQYGNVRIYYSDILEFFKKAGYETTATWSNKRLWDYYKWYIGKAADRI